MISRLQRILFAVLLIAIVAMAAILIRLRERAQDRLHVAQGTTAPVETASSTPQTVTLVIPNDLDGSLQDVERSLPLPADNSTKARVLLEDLLETFHQPHSTHPIATISPADEPTARNPSVNEGIDDVFLMPVPQPAASASPGSANPHNSTPQSANAGTLAVVDFSAAFAASQPSGIEPETLTLLSILETLHANIPSITQVRFLIDGHPAQTLAGHADLTRTYLATDTTTGPQHP
ncbi:MAG: GerMN domain-containing protein [Acidobacteriaceae bacterium]